MSARTQESTDVASIARRRFEAGMGARNG